MTSTLLLNIITYEKTLIISKKNLYLKKLMFTWVPCNRNVPDYGHFNWDGAQYSRNVEGRTLSK